MQIYLFCIPFHWEVNCFVATMEDIARHLGTTKGTVSKALSGAQDVSEATRKAVLEMAVELGYTKLNRTDRNKRICIFIENMDYRQPEDFGYEIISGFRKAAAPAGYIVDIIPLTIAMERNLPYDSHMLLGGYQGALFLGLSFDDPWIRDMKTCVTPTVLFDNRVNGNSHVTYLSIDNDEGLDKAVARLKALGHRRIGYLSGALGSYVFQVRYKAFQRAIHRNQLPAEPSLTGYSYYTSECLERDLPRLLKKGCTAIVCSHDLLAHSVMIHCQEVGLHIPEDISIIGVDDLPMCRYTTPPLSSIRQNREELGKSAFYALSTQINLVPISSLLLHAELIERGSIGAAPVTSLANSADTSDLAAKES